MEKSYIRKYRATNHSTEWMQLGAAMQMRLDIAISDAVKYYDEYQGDVI